jgi:hypothetical protein
MISFMSEVHSPKIQLRSPFGLCEFKYIYFSIGVLKILQTSAAILQTSATILQTSAAIGKMTISPQFCYSLIIWVGFVICGCLDNVYTLNLFGCPD